MRTLSKTTVLVLTAFLVLPGALTPAAEPKVENALAKTPGGLVVYLGCENPKTIAKLRQNDSCLVQGLDTDPQKVAAARAHFFSAGLSGPISADTFDGERLPYVDNLVNLLIAEELGDVSMPEVMRVLRPGGVARVRGVDAVKPRPEEIDHWTHYLHGPDNNAVARDRIAGAPQHIQWVAGPKWARHHNHLSSTSAMVTAGGRIFSIMDEGSIASLNQPSDWQLTARDAFNGILLWGKPIGPWEDHMRKFRSGPTELPRRLVADKNRIFVTLGYGKPVVALDAASGKKLRTYTGTKETVEILHDNGFLYLCSGT